MSKIICIGDVHASGFNDDPIVENLPERLHYIKKTLNYIADYGKKNGITEYVMLGDLIHDKTIIYNVAQSMLYEFFNEHKDCRFVIISGNHDLSSTGENQKSAIEVFGSLPNVKVCIDKPCESESISALFVPFTNDFLTRIKDYKDKRFKFLFAHLGLNEAVLQSGLSRVDKLRLNQIGNFKTAILGHYHKPQNFSNGVTDVWYAGSIIPRDWNDKNEEKRFLVLDVETSEVESVPLSPVGVPMFREFVITEGMETSTVKTMLTEAAEYRKKGDKVRVVNKAKQKVKEDLADVIVLEQREVDVTNRGITVEQTKMEQCKKYLEIKEIPEDEREKYIKMLMDNKLLEITEEK